MRDKGSYECLSEEWLIDNLPPGWTYDCHLGSFDDDQEGGQDGFLIYAPGRSAESVPLFIPLDLLVRDRRWRRDRQS
jgi:hypothetical protein